MFSRDKERVYWEQMGQVKVMLFRQRLRRTLKRPVIITLQIKQQALIITLHSVVMKMYLLYYKLLQ